MNFDNLKKDALAWGENKLNLNLVPPNESGKWRLDYTKEKPFF